VRAAVLEILIIHTLAATSWDEREDEVSRHGKNHSMLHTKQKQLGDFCNVSEGLMKVKYVVLVQFILCLEYVMVCCMAGMQI